ncbi:MAG TPA: hypothetical protein P5110_05245 [Candidatus Omnitrophota bacterium]|nr:hypothetical protein [Candidatus Omnitrophota bacterium]
MKIGTHQVQTFKIRNRKGYAAVSDGHLTEGSTLAQALERMEKALRRTRTKTK